MIFFFSLYSIDGEYRSIHDGVVVKADKVIGRLRVGELDDGRVVFFPDVESANTSAGGGHRTNLGKVG